MRPPWSLPSPKFETLFAEAEVVEILPDVRIETTPELGRLAGRKSQGKVPSRVRGGHPVLIEHRARIRLPDGSERIHCSYIRQPKIGDSVLVYVGRYPAGTEPSAHALKLRRLRVKWRERGRKKK